MNNYIIIFIIVVTSVTIFVSFVKIFDNIPKRYHKSIQLMSSLGIILIISGSFITYHKDKQDKESKSKKEYADSILLSFEKIDDFLINNYNDMSIILDILYYKVRIPSSDQDMNSLLKKMDKKMDKKIKDTLFLIYGKLTIIFEKMYLIDQELFDNINLGVRVRLYTENIFFYEYWNSTKNIYNTNFIKFMENRYSYLTISDFRFYKPNRIVNRIPYLDDVSFIFKSAKPDGLWY